MAHPVITMPKLTSEATTNANPAVDDSLSKDSVCGQAVTARIAAPMRMDPRIDLMM
ncbi:MAG: hypothetical protein ACRDHO_03945 [Actinomycetota bacterium]